MKTRDNQVWENYKVSVICGIVAGCFTGGVFTLFSGGNTELGLTAGLCVGMMSIIAGQIL